MVPEIIQHEKKLKDRNLVNASVDGEDGISPFILVKELKIQS